MQITNTINASDAKEEFTEIVNRVSLNKERVILTRRGKEIAAIIPIEDLQLICATLNKHDLATATESLQEARTKGMVSLEDFIKQIGDVA